MGWGISCCTPPQVCSLTFLNRREQWGSPLRRPHQNIPFPKMNRHWFSIVGSTWKTALAAPRFRGRTTVNKLFHIQATRNPQLSSPSLKTAGPGRMYYSSFLELNPLWSVSRGRAREISRLNYVSALLHLFWGHVSLCSALAECIYPPWHRSLGSTGRQCYESYVAGS